MPPRLFSLDRALFLEKGPKREWRMLCTHVNPARVCVVCVAGWRKQRVGDGELGSKAEAPVLHRPWDVTPQMEAPSSSPAARVSMSVIPCLPAQELCHDYDEPAKSHHGCLSTLPYFPSTRTNKRFGGQRTPSPRPSCHLAFLIHLYI